MYNERRQARLLMAETEQDTIRHELRGGTVLTRAERENLTGKTPRTFQKILADQRQWVKEHAPFDTVIKLPLTQFITVDSDEHKAMAGALVPFKDASIQSVHPDQYDLSDYAMKQLLARLGYDTRLYQKLAGAGKLNLWNINYLIQNFYTDFVRLRCQDHNLVRGLVTQSYEPFDNLELFEAVEPYMENAETHWDYSDPVLTHLSVTWPHTATEIRVGDVVKTGIHITNSEVGARSVTIAAYTYRLKCSNGMTGREDGGIYRFRHTGDGDNLRDKIKAAIESTYMETTKMIGQLKEALNKQINDPATYLENIAKDKNNGVTQDQFKNMLNSFLNEPENNLYGVVNAVTRTAHEYYTGETRYDLERLGQKVLNQGLSQ